LQNSLEELHELATLQNQLVNINGRESFYGFNRAVCPFGEDPKAHHQIIIDACEDILSGEKKRVMIFMPPGGAKSTYATIRFPAYYLGKTKNKGIITSSYGTDLAHSFGRKVRNLVSSSRYKEIFPKVQLAGDAKSKGEWETTTGGYYYAVGAGGGVTGRRGDGAVVDDPVKSAQDADSKQISARTWEWYQSELRTRLKPDAFIMLIMTRWHEQDLAGRILPEKWAGESGWITARDGEKWWVICLPAQAEHKSDPLVRKIGDWLWPEYFTPKFWAQAKKTQTPRNWQSLYQQRPTADEGSYFMREWFQYYENKPSHLNVYVSADFAVTEGDGDFTEIGVFGVCAQGNIYVLDWFTGQVTSLAWIKELIEIFKYWKPQALISEAGSIRRATEPMLRREMRRERVYTRLEWLPATASKEANARSIQAMIENGIVFFRDDASGEHVVDQACRFPTGRYDDAVDTLSLFGRFIDKVWEANPPKSSAKPDKLPDGVISSEMFAPEKPKSW